MVGRLGWFSAGFVEVYMHLVISGGRVQLGKSVRIIWSGGAFTWSSGADCGWGRDCGGGVWMKYHTQ